MSQTNNRLSNTVHAHYRKPLPASGEEVRVNTTGSFFIIIDQDFPGTDYKFEVAIEDGPFFPACLGFRFRCPPGDRFSFLRFKSRSSEAITIEFYAGTVEVEDTRLNLITGRQTLDIGLDAGDILAINPAAQSLAAGLVRLTASSQTFLSKRMVSVAVKSGDVVVNGVTLTTADGGVDFLTRGRFDVVTSVEVNATAGEALVATLG